jgi:hypothetical protein
VFATMLVPKDPALFPEGGVFLRGAGPKPRADSIYFFFLATFLVFFAVRKRRCGGFAGGLYVVVGFFLGGFPRYFSEVNIAASAYLQRPCTGSRCRWRRSCLAASHSDWSRHRAHIGAVAPGVAGRAMGARVRARAIILSLRGRRDDHQRRSEKQLLHSQSPIGLICGQIQPWREERSNPATAIATQTLVEGCGKLW